MKRGLLFAALTAASVLSGACTAEEDNNVMPDTPETDTVECCFSAVVEESWPARTKTLLSARNVENKVTGLMVAVYRQGELYSRYYYDGLPESLTYRLQERKPFTIYAMANMGDYREALPRYEDDLASLVYRLESYLDVNENGMPMAATLDYVPGVDPDNQVIALRRLFAKVTVNLSCNWPGGRIESARIWNLNGLLRPFGDSAAQSADDLCPAREGEQRIRSASASVTLYVPENLQGTVSGILDPKNKTQDRNAAIDAMKDRLTYLEVTVSGSQLYQGTMIYRNYLGENATDSFDIVRNTSYVWDIEYCEDNLSRDEWKWDNSLDDTRYVDSDNNIYVSQGDVVSIGDYLDSNLDLSKIKWSLVEGSAPEEVIGDILNGDNASGNSFSVHPDSHGGSSFQIRVEPLANSTLELRKTITFLIRDRLNLGYALEGGGDAYPYQILRFKSAARFTQAQAQSHCESMNLALSSSNTLEAYQSFSYGTDSGGCYIVMQLVATRPGRIKCLGISDTGMDTFSFTVWEPYLRPDQSTVRLDLRGYESSLNLSLCDLDDNALPDGVDAAHCTMTLTLNDTYGTDVHIGLNSAGGTGYTATVHNYGLSLRGFSGLEGLDPENFTFGGLTIPATATFTYPNGYSLSSQLNVHIKGPHFNANEYDGQTYTYRVNQGYSNSDTYISSTPECYPAYMLDWPDRTFTVDLSRGGARTVPSDMEVWKGERSNLTLSYYSPTSAGAVRFTERLSQWGPLFYGARITNGHSGETIALIHSIIRIYCHYSAFATFDAKQSSSIISGSPWASYVLNPANISSGCLRVSLKDNFGKGPNATLMSFLITKPTASGVDPNPVYRGFSKQSDGYSYRAPSPGGYNGTTMYYMGYKDTESGYELYYSIPLCTYTQSIYCQWELLNWRAVAAANAPLYTAGTGGFWYNNKYCTPLVKTAGGTYNFSVISNQDYHQGLSGAYLDDEGLSYQYLHLFWETRGGSRRIASKYLNAIKWPSSRQYVSLINGWYDPSLYYNAQDSSKNGIPASGKKTGMYFRCSGDWYYTYDNPFSFNSFDASDPSCIEDYNLFLNVPAAEYRNSVEYFDYGTLPQRDRDAPRD